MNPGKPTRQPRSKPEGISYRALLLLSLSCLSLLCFTVPANLLPEDISVANLARTSEQRIAIKVDRSEGLMAVLQRHGVELSLAQQLIGKIWWAVNFKDAPAVQRFDLVVGGAERRVRALEFFSQEHAVLATAIADGWHIERRRIEEIEASRTVRGRVVRDFAGSVRTAGLPEELILQLVEIFERDADLLTQSRRGDEFAVTFEERIYEDGRRVSGRIIAAALVVGRRPMTAFYFRDLLGSGGYYDSRGVSLRRAFLDSPVKYERISSTFDLARPDPLTGVERPHEAIDYVAVEGTAVHAIGPGVVEYVGSQGSYGNLVRIKHGGGYASAYAHLSLASDHIAEGTKVEAGEVIGYVGQTGYATGPHLHFEFSRNDERIDSLAFDIPTPVLTRKDLKRFQEERDTLVALLRPKEAKPVAMAAASTTNRRR
ncbi:MAG: hypothetical protein FJ145_10365 [Deltaproteobacteria bacterium]|nr:hypothetical protein [Deltaproteobacteria bacterium]